MGQGYRGNPGSSLVGSAMRTMLWAQAKVAVAVGVTAIGVGAWVIAVQAADGPPPKSHRIGKEALIELPKAALYSLGPNFRPGDGDTVDTNPPRFCWSYSPNPAKSHTDISVKEFQFQVACDKEFKDLAVNVRTNCNFYNFIAPFKKKACWWRVGYINSDTEKEPSAWSKVRSFTIADGATVWDRSMLADEKYMAEKGKHPHMLFNARNRKAMRKYMETNAAEIWGMIKSRADQTIAAPWWSRTPDPKVVDIGTWANGITYVALAWQLTRDPKYLAAKPQEALVRMARHYLATGGWRKDVVSGGDGFAVTGLGYTYDWLHEVMTPRQRKEVLVAIEANCLWIRNAWWWFTMRKPVSFAKGEPANPLAIYKGGLMAERWSGFKVPSGHPLINFYMATTTALAAYPESAIAKEYLDLSVNYAIGKTVPYGGEGGINQGRPYGYEDVFSFNAAFPLAVLCQMIFPEAKFNLNPFWRVNADWWSRMIPVGFFTGHEPWGDTGWGRYHMWAFLGFGRDLALFTGDGKAWKHYKEESAVQAVSPPLHFTAHMAPFYFKEPAPEENKVLARVFPVEGWVIGATYPSNTKACFHDGVGFVLQARPSGAEGVAHSSPGSDLSFQIWAYGTTVTDAGSGMTPYGKSPMCHYSLLVDGLGMANSPYPTDPFLSRVVAFRETPDYTYCAADGTNSYARTPRALAGWLWPGTYTKLHAPGPLSYLKKVRRHLLFVRKKYFVMLDDLETDKPARFSWLYHIPLLYRIRDGVKPPKYERLTIKQLEPRDSLKLDASPCSFKYIASNVYPFAEMPDTVVNVPVHVAHLARVGDLELLDLKGEKVASNPFTGEDYYKHSDTYKRPHALWVTNKKPETKWRFLTVIYPQKPGGPAPEIKRLDDWTVEVTCGDEKDVISFDPKTKHPATLIVDLPAMVPVPVKE